MSRYFEGRFLRRFDCVGCQYVHTLQFIKTVMSNGLHVFTSVAGNTVAQLHLLNSLSVSWFPV